MDGMIEWNRTRVANNDVNGGVTKNNDFIPQTWILDSHDCGLRANIWQNMTDN